MLDLHRPSADAPAFESPSSSHPPRSRPSLSQLSPKQSKRKRADVAQLDDIHSPTKRNRNASYHGSVASKEIESDPTLHWVEQQSWPPAQETDSQIMSSQSGKKRGGSPSRSPSTHWSERYRRLEEFGIRSGDSPDLQPQNLQLCRRLLEERFREVRYANIPQDKFADLSSRVQYLNETRIQRDITPWVLPSPDLLQLWGEEGLQDLGEELNAEWIRCSTMGWTRPKPDVTVGLAPRAFLGEDQQRLQSYATPDAPVYVTPNICFPFLVCEAKSSPVGLDEADGQNLHSASIAVRSIFAIYEKAWGWRSPRMLEDLNGQILVFSISHDHHRVQLYGHFAVCGDATSASGLAYYRYLIKLVSLRTGGGSERLVPYNFVRNLYDIFVPAHLGRLRSAVAGLPLPRTQSLAPSEALEGESEDPELLDPSSPPSASEGSRGRPRLQRQPSTASIATMRTQPSQLIHQLTQTKEDNTKQREESIKQREEYLKQREESVKQLAQLWEDHAREREESARQYAQQLQQLGDRLRNRA